MFTSENWNNDLVAICENWNSGLVFICNTHKVSIYCCLFAIRKVSISITAGTASANTEINVEKATNRRQAGVQSNLPGQPEWPGVERARAVG